MMMMTAPTTILGMTRHQDPPRQTSAELQAILWEQVQNLRTGTTTPAKANAVVREVNTELRVIAAELRTGRALRGAESKSKPRISGPRLGSQPGGTGLRAPYRAMSH
jgi:hypothetical protein